MSKDHSKNYGRTLQQRSKKKRDIAHRQCYCHACSLCVECAVYHYPPACPEGEYKVTIGDMWRRYTFENKQRVLNQDPSRWPVITPGPDIEIEALLRNAFP